LQKLPCTKKYGARSRVTVPVIVGVVAVDAGSVVAQRAKCGLAANMHDTGSSLFFPPKRLRRTTISTSINAAAGAAPLSVPRSTPPPDNCYL
jgi:hypothetical protein